MLPDKRFLNLPKAFWANVRSLSQKLGYTARGTGQILVPTLERLRAGLLAIGVSDRHLFAGDGRPTDFGRLVLDYFAYRAKVLNEFVEPRLMDAEQARALFNDMRKQLCPACPLPMNKQKGKKKTPAFLTGIINMLIEVNAGGMTCDFDPRQLTTITREGVPVRTLARRVDGAFPAVVNPVAVWEIKEYYYTTTFGSRVSDGVYESLLDGMELEELREHEHVDVKHYLMIDAHYTWWKCGRSYLCRLIDMLHMGYVDEVLFGREVVDRLPTLVRQWVEIVHQIS